MKKILNQKKGITLIALVITIIVLLILAGISISMLSGENGILQKATEAKTKSDETQIKERIKLAYHSALTGGQGSYTKESLEEELKKEFEKNYSVEDLDDANWKLKAQGQEVTIPAGKKIKVDRTGISVGDYITYNSPTANVKLSNADTGYSGEQTLPKKDLFRIMKMNDDGSMVLVGAMIESDKTICFNGTKGYNNAVYTLNQKCSDLYKNESMGITARSIKLEDITSNFNSTGIDRLTSEIDRQLNSLKTGTYIINVDKINKTITYKTRTKYPDLFQYEIGGQIGNLLTTGETGRSESYSKYNGVTSNTTGTSTTSLKVPFTRYGCGINATDFSDETVQEVYKNMFFQTGTSYWLATRCTYGDSNNAMFGLSIVQLGAFNNRDLYFSKGANGQSNTVQARVCPVIFIPANVQVSVCIGENDSSNAHEIQ